MELGLVYQVEADPALSAYSYCDWAGDTSDRNSIRGFLFRMAGSVISWCPRKQTVGAACSYEAKHISVTTIIQAAVWLRRVVREMLNPLSKLKKKETRADANTLFHIDNIGSI